jgi:lipopolysaccharide/colanic/teichoic acid biosynthesis glycosyltransferase
MSIAEHKIRRLAAGIPGAGPEGGGGFYPRIKPSLDSAMALVLLVLAAPVMFAVMLLVRLTSRGPAIYSQQRLGKGGRVFTIYKIRTMYQDSERHSGAIWSVPGDPRITPVGRILRFTHLDELPQLFNVLLGDMSLVGPRPERPEFLPKLERTLPAYRRRLAVRPGVTGLAQVQLPPDTDLASVRRKLDYDLFYVERMNSWLDVRILVATALKCVGVPFAAIGLLLGLPGPNGGIEPGSLMSRADLSYQAIAPVETPIG